MNYTTWLFISVTLIVAIVQAEELVSEENVPPIVSSPLGQIRGFHKKSAKRNVFAAFEGIPYAQPPVGQLRFEPPKPVEAWNGIWDATFLTECAHTSLMQRDVVQGEENCLYINVYVPDKNPDPKKKLDVIVHIHGGLFMYGSGHSYAHPEYFMDENVIFVTFNYRLNILGFLSTDDSVVSGNMGLKDQVLALKWIQENIASFGGNPNSVTLTGLSAGASSVHYHYISDMSAGLFHKGFSQSGVALNSFALQDEPLKRAQQLGLEVGCPITTTAVLVKCLKHRPLNHILSKLEKFFANDFLPVAPFAPVLEKGSNPFITKNPFYLLSIGKVQSIPWLVSTVSHEGLFPAVHFLNKLDQLEENWTKSLPSLLDYHDTLADSIWAFVGKELKEQYLDNANLTNDNFDKLVQMVTDRFLFDVDSAIKLQARANKAPVYYYQFNYVTDTNKDQTVSHGEDGQYFYYNMYSRQPTPNELKMKDLLMDMLITFAKTGNPRIGSSIWQPVSSSQLNFLNVNTLESEEIKLESADELVPRTFWKSLGLLENQNLVIMKDEL